MEDLTIGQLAQQTGVSRKAIRLYEEKELILPSIKRSEGNYRVYNQEHVFCINGIKTTPIIRRITGGNERFNSDFRKKNTVEIEPHLQHLLKDKLTKIDEQINELQKLRKHIESYLDSPKEAFNQMEGFKQ